MSVRLPGSLAGGDGNHVTTVSTSPVCSLAIALTSSHVVEEPRPQPICVDAPRRTCRQHDCDLHNVKNSLTHAASN